MIRIADFEANKRAGAVPMNETAFTVLCGLQARTGAGEHVFSVNGKPPKDFKKSFATAKRLSGIDPAFRWHDLRHDFAAHLRLKKVDLPTISHLLHHSDIRTTMRYAGVKNDELAAAVKLLDKPLPSSCQIEAAKRNKGRQAKTRASAANSLKPKRKGQREA